MSDLLEPLFGAGGARTAQFVITVVVVIGLIAAAYWVVRRFAGFRIGGIGRGRVPRLAVVDAVAIDNRRRLVLIRRDNVEHLLLIGGPSDVVVEPGIVRPRRRAPDAARAQQPQDAAVTPAPSPVARPPGEAGAPPVALPASRAAPRPVAQEPVFQPFQRAGTPPPDIVVDNDRRPAPPRPPPNQPPAVSVAPITARPGPTEPFLPEVVRPPAETSEPTTTRAPAPATAEQPPPNPDQAALDLGDRTAQATPRDEVSEGEGDTAAKVSHLEQEMAKLLGEITAPRSSS